ncbi:ParA family protein [Deinococcus kurensis]|uniref:ParA family protein n=1 Tax=Deinococcus kurensis TaxID=2662757 RepID=UPI0012D2D88C|nr:ParA family protein [Deinococcus kurensis]
MTLTNPPAQQMFPTRGNVIAVVNLKGGSTKTNVAVHLATLLMERGEPVHLIDADPNANAAQWVEGAGLQDRIGVTRVDNLTMKAAVETARRYGYVIIDTPGNQDSMAFRGVTYADRIVIPMAPTPQEVDLLNATLDIVQDICGDTKPWWVLLTKATKYPSETKRLARLLMGAGTPLIEAQIPDLKRYAFAFQELPELSEDDPYRRVLEQVQSGVRFFDGYARQYAAILLEDALALTDPDERAAALHAAAQAAVDDAQRAAAQRHLNALHAPTE